MTTQTAWPTQIRVDSGRHALQIGFDDGQNYTLSAEMLRVLSPSAEVQGHSPEERITVGGKRNVAIREVIPVGNYAIRIAFDDGHDTGIYTWDYLATLGKKREALWAAHLKELDDKGIAR